MHLVEDEGKRRDQRKEVERIPDLGCGVEGLEFRVSSAVCRVWGVGCRVEGAGCSM